MTATLHGDISYRAGGEYTSEGQENTDRVFKLVRTTSVDESFTNIIAATGINFFDAHPQDSNMRARRADIDFYQNDPFMRVVEFQYSNKNELDEEEDANPLNRDTRISWNSITYQKFVFKDRNGDAIMTTAGEFFEEVPGIDDVRWVLHIEKNVSVVPLWVLAYENKLNDSAVVFDNVSFSPELLKLQGLNISPTQFENQTEFRALSFDLHYKSDGHTLDIANRGFYEQVTVPGGTDYIRKVKSPAYDENDTLLQYNNPNRRWPSTPSPLYGNTAEDIAADRAGSQIIKPTTENAVILKFDVYDTADFSALPGAT